MNKTLKNYLIGAGVLVALTGAGVKSFERSFHYHDQAKVLRERTPVLNRLLDFEEKSCLVSHLKGQEKKSLREDISNLCLDYPQMIKDPNLENNEREYNNLRNHENVYNKIVIAPLVGTILFGGFYLICVMDGISRLYEKRKRKEKIKKIKTNQIKKTNHISSITSVKSDTFGKSLIY